MNRSLTGWMIIFLVFSGITASSQVNDAGLWLSANVEKKIYRSFSVTFTEEVRMNENITEIGAIFSDLGLSYKFLKRFRVSANVRYINKRRLDDSYDNRIRYYFDLSYREKVNPVIFLFRVRLQSQYTDIFSSPDGKIPDKYARTKLTVKLDLNKRMEPYLYAESFFLLNDPNGMLFNGTRYCAGIEYSFSKHHMVDIFYMIQKEYQVNNPEMDFIIGIGYYFTLPDF